MMNIQHAPEFAMAVGELPNHYPTVVRELGEILTPERLEIAYAFCNRRAMNFLIDRGLLEWRAPRYAYNGMIDVEILHPVWGWVLFSASPDDVERYGQRIFWALHKLGVAERYTQEYAPEQVRRFVEIEHASV